MTTTRQSRIFASGPASTLYVTLPAAIVDDSQFPFEADDQVIVSIEGDGLRISRDPEAGSDG